MGKKQSSSSSSSSSSVSAIPSSLSLISPPKSLEYKVETKLPSITILLPSSPSGMVKLASMDKIKVKQKMHLREVLCCCCENQELYELLSPDGSQSVPIFVADEESGCCMRSCCKNLRRLKIDVTDRDGSLMFTAQRHFKCGLCICCAIFGQCYCCKSDCCPTCLDEIRVFGPNEEKYGKIIESWSLLRSFYKVYDGNGELVYNLQGSVGPCTCLFCCKTTKFILKNPRTGLEEGKIYKQHAGILKEVFTEADNFGVDFPAGIDVKLKAILISAVFLIDTSWIRRRQQ